MVQLPAGALSSPEKPRGPKLKAEIHPNCRIWARCRQYPVRPSISLTAYRNSTLLCRRSRCGLRVGNGGVKRPGSPFLFIGLIDGAGFSAQNGLAQFGLNGFNIVCIEFPYSGQHAGLPS